MKKKNVNQQPVDQKQYHRTVDGKDVPVSEEVCHARGCPARADPSRSGNCPGRNGHCCTGDCSQCDWQEKDAPLSLDALEADSSNLLPVSEDVAEIVMYGILLEKLNEELDKLTSTDALILRLFGEGLTDRKISRKLKAKARSDSSIEALSQESVSIRRITLFAALYEKLKDYR